MPTGVYPAAEAWFQSGIPDYYPGQTVAGLNNYQTQGYREQLGALNQTKNQAGKVWQNYLGAIKAPRFSVNPYLDEIVQNFQNLSNRDFNRNVIPAMRGNAVNTGAAGSSAEGIAQGIATGDYQANKDNTVANMMGQAYESAANRHESALDRQLQAIGQAPGMLGMYNTAMTAPGGLMSAWGAQNQQLQQQRIQGEMDRWNYYRDAPLMKLMNYAQLIGGQPAGNLVGSTSGTGNNTVTPGGTGNYNQTLGWMSGLMQGLPSIYSAFQSQNNAVPTFNGSTQLPLVF